MPRLNRTRALGVGLALISLAFAACSKSGSTPIPTVSPSPSPVPTISGIPVGLSSPCASSLGIAYQPDGGQGAGFTGVQVIHFEDSSRSLCASVAASATPPGVAFASAVGPLAFSSDRVTALAILAGGSGGFTLAQDVFGGSSGSLVPVGATYNLAANPPTPVPTTSGSPQATATPTNAPLFTDVQGAAVLTTATTGILGFTIGTPAAGSPNAIVALTSLNNAPPQYGAAVLLQNSPNYTLKSIPNNPRSILQIGAIDSVNFVALARGPQDLLAISVSASPGTYTFNPTAIDATLGSNVLLRGNGAMAFDPADGTRALVGGTTTGGTSTLTLVTGLPSKIVRSSAIAMPGAIRSVSIVAAGTIGIIGTDGGIVVVNGIATGTLSTVAPFAPAAGSTTASAPGYRTCSGAIASLSSIYSAAISGDQKFLVALGTTPGVTCPSGYNASIVAVPFNPATGGTPSPAPTSSASPAPTSFVQNNVIAPPANTDFFNVF